MLSLLFLFEQSHAAGIHLQRILQDVLRITAGFRPRLHFKQQAKIRPAGNLHIAIF